MGLAVPQSCQSSQIRQVPRTPSGRRRDPNSPSELQKAQPGSSSSSSSDRNFVNILELKFWVSPGLGLLRKLIRKENGGCPGGAGAEWRREQDQGMRGGRGSQAFKVLLRSVSFPTRGPARLGPSQPRALLPGPACFSSRCLFPRLEEERKRGRRAW